jgi:hypothetical protein
LTRSLTDGDVWPKRAEAYHGSIERRTNARSGSEAIASWLLAIVVFVLGDLRGRIAAETADVLGLAPRWPARRAHECVRLVDSQTAARRLEANTRQHRQTGLAAARCAHQEASQLGKTPSKFAAVGVAS